MIRRILPSSLISYSVHLQVGLCQHNFFGAPIETPVVKTPTCPALIARRVKVRVGRVLAASLARCKYRLDNSVYRCIGVSVYRCVGVSVYYARAMPRVSGGQSIVFTLLRPHLVVPSRPGTAVPNTLFLSIGLLQKFSISEDNRLSCTDDKTRVDSYESI